MDINFLQDLNRYKMDFWSRKILEEIIKKANPPLYSNKNITPNYDNKKNTNKKNNVNNVGHFSPWSDNKVNRNIMKRTSYNYSKLCNKFQ